MLVNRDLHFNITSFLLVQGMRVLGAGFCYFISFWFLKFLHPNLHTSYCLYYIFFFNKPTHVVSLSSFSRLKKKSCVVVPKAFAFFFRRRFDLRVGSSSLSGVCLCSRKKKRKDCCCRSCQLLVCVRDKKRRLGQTVGRSKTFPHSE